MSNKSNNLFYTAPQQSQEFARSQYIGAIDLLREAESQTQSFESLRKDVVENYRRTMPELFAGIDRLENRLGKIEAAVSESRDFAQMQLVALEGIQGSLFDIQNTLEYGFQALAVQLDQTNSFLQDIRRILAAPVATQAAEFLDRGTGFFSDGFFEEAESDLVQVTTLDPANFAAWYLLALIRSEKLGDLEGAHEALDRCERYASKRDPSYHSLALLQRALLTHRVEKNPSEAGRLARKAVDADRKNMQATFLLAEIEAELGNLQESQALLARCERVDSIFFLRSASSSILMSSGIHDRVFDSAQRAYHAFSKDIASAAQGSRSLAQAIRNCGLDENELLDPLGDWERLAGDLNQDDYLLQREIFDRARMFREHLMKSMAGLESKISMQRSDLSQNERTSKKTAASSVGQKYERRETGARAVSVMVALALFAWFFLGTGRGFAEGVVFDYFISWSDYFVEGWHEPDKGFFWVLSMIAMIAFGFGPAILVLGVAAFLIAIISWPIFSILRLGLSILKAPDMLLSESSLRRKAQKQSREFEKHSQELEGSLQRLRQNLVSPLIPAE